MDNYICEMCGYLYDEARNHKKFDSLEETWSCPLCASPKSFFEKRENREKSNDKENTYDADEFSKYDSNHITDIQKMAETGISIGAGMETLKTVPNFEEILVLGAQLHRSPLFDDSEVNTETIIGKKAKKPLKISSPIFISHMSFGALSKRAKRALAKGSAIAKTAMCSGEGGILPEEREEAYKYIFEYTPNLYSVTDKNLRESDAIEIKIGQGTKPGLGGHLPGSKVTEEIAKIRNKPVGKDISSPSHFQSIRTSRDLKKLVEELRVRSGGRPIGVKIAAGHIEKDLEFISKASVDFITIDGRGGATGSSPKALRDSSSVPTVYALSRAKKYIKENNLDIDLVITGGLRTSADFVKALAMGADAIAIASAALIALGCKRFRICDLNKCPVGIATQDEELSSRIDIDMGAKRVSNFLNVSNEELKMFARCMGYDDVHKISIEDIETTSEEISKYTGIKHV